MTRIIAIANQKGGVGKTTTTVNLAAGLAKVGKRVLMVDLDPQGNATMGSGVDKRQLKATIYDVLLETSSVAQARVTSDKLVAAGCGYDVLGANRELAGAEVELVELERRERDGGAHVVRVLRADDGRVREAGPRRSELLPRREKGGGGGGV